MGVIDAIYYPIGVILRIGRRRRVRGRGGMHSGRHDVVQFRIAADKDLEAAARESRLLCSTDL